MNADPHALNAAAVSRYTNAPHLSVVDFLLNIIPDTVVGVFAKGDILPVLCFAVLFGIALSRLGDRGQGARAGARRGRGGFVRDHRADHAGGAAGGVRRDGVLDRQSFGIGTLVNLIELMACFYATCAIFVFVVLTIVMRLCGLSLVRLLAYLKEEFFIVLGTSSSEAAMPTLMEKLENMGCPQSMVGLVVPLGYAFNLDGTSIYFTMAIAFIAQALNIPLSWAEYLEILTVLLLTSKGAAAVTGGGFITLAATLATLGGKIPVESIALILGIDRFMSEARAITNLFGNAVATVVVARWEGVLDLPRARAVLARREPVAVPVPL